jgi:hypothetical protein
VGIGIEGHCGDVVSQGTEDWETTSPLAFLVAMINACGEREMVIIYLFTDVPLCISSPAPSPALAGREAALCPLDYPGTVLSFEC